MGRLNRRSRGGGGGGGETTQHVRGSYKSFKRTNLMVVEGMHQFISPTWYCLQYYSSRFDVECGIQCVIASWFVIVHGSQDGTFQSIGIYVVSYELTARLAT